MKVNFRSIIMLIVIVATIILAVSFFSNRMKDEDKFGYSDVIDMFEQDLVHSFVVDGNLNMTIKAYRAKLDDKNNYILDENNMPIVVMENDAYVFDTYTYQLNYNFQLEEINRLAEAKLNSTAENRFDNYDYQPQPEIPWYQQYLP